MHKRAKISTRPLVLAVAACLALTAAGHAAAQEASYIYISPVDGLAAPPAEKPPVSSPDLSAPVNVYPGANYVVTWGASPEATRYDVFQQSAGSAVYSGADLSLSRTAPTIVGATDAFWVQACNAVGCAITSPAHGVTVVAPPAPPVPTVSAPDTAAAGDAIKVQWTQSDDPNGYGVTYHAKMRVNSDADTSLFDGAGLFASVSNAVGGNTYTFTAQACNAYTCSVFSAPVTTTIPEPPCTATASSFASGQYTINVPAGCHSMSINAKGAGGGAAWYVYGPGYAIVGGVGASVTGVATVAPGDVVEISVGSGGGKVTGNGTCSSDGGSFNGAGGGGSSVILNGAYIAVAGGGGGSACGSKSAAAQPGVLDLSGPTSGNGGNAGTSRSTPGIAGTSYYSSALSGAAWDASGGGAGGQTKAAFTGQPGAVTLTWSTN